MADCSDEPKLFHQVMPSLFHIAVVRIAVPLLNKFGMKRLKKVSKDIVYGNLAKYNGGHHSRKTTKAKEKLLLIPAHLRSKVLNAVMGLHYAVCTWEKDHRFIFTTTEFKKSIFCWRPDGTINRIKTAQQLVLNENVDIKKRFEVACYYFFEKSVQNLFQAIEASGKTESFAVDNNYSKRFWVRWIRGGSCVPWLQAFQEYLVVPPNGKEFLTLRWSPFLALLPQQEKEYILPLLQSADTDDYRVCLYATKTKEEESEILEMNSFGLLMLHVENWPLQSSLLEVAKKVFDNITDFQLRVLLKRIWRYYKSRRQDFDYLKLFADFWTSSPCELKEKVLETDDYLTEAVKSCFKKMERKRKNEFVSDINRKKRKTRRGFGLREKAMKLKDNPVEYEAFIRRVKSLIETIEEFKNWNKDMVQT